MEDVCFLKFQTLSNHHTMEKPQVHIRNWDLGNSAKPTFKQWPLL